MKSILFISAMLMIFSSCKEEEPVDLCSNGFVDPGEDNPDCGGDCPPCAPNFVSYVFAEFDYTDMSFPNNGLVYDGSNWSLKLLNDSTDVTINLGNDGAIGNYPVTTSGSSCFYRGIEYPEIATNNLISISYHDQENKLMSGFFNLKFYRIGFTDTVRIKDGRFEYLEY